MITINIDGDLRLIRGFEKAVRKIGSPKPVLDNIGTVLQDEFVKNITSEGERLNAKWSKLKKATLKQKIRMGYAGLPTMVRSGKLIQSFRKDVTRFNVRVHNPVKYFKYHQRGDKPQIRRRMILFPERLKQEVIAQFTKFINEAFRGM